MRAAILAVGSELLGTDRIDTNSLRLTVGLRRFGVELVSKAVLGDSLDELARWIRNQLGKVDLILVSGGLGPTSDDLTREAVAAALRRDLHEDPEIAADIERKFARMGMKMPRVNLRQALVIEGSTILSNPRGTAPGARLDQEGGTIFLFPGVPAELDYMAETYLTPWLERHGDGDRVESRSLRVACRSESAVEQRLQPLYQEFDPSAITVLASPGDIEVRFTATGTESERRRTLRQVMGEARALLGDSVYADTGEATLESVVGELLTSRERTVATAESCTAGLLAERLTRVAGSSQYFLGGLVTYSDESKSELLGIRAQTLAHEGAVSEVVARSMAEVVRQRLDSDYGIGITGIAGPSGGSEAKPVGTVHVAVSTPESGDDATVHRALRLPGDRRRIRRLATQWALDLLRRSLRSG